MTLKQEVKELRTRLDRMEREKKSNERSRRHQELCRIGRTGTIEQIKAATKQWNKDVEAGVI